MVELIARSRKAHILILILLVLAVFFNSLNNPLVWDDQTLIRDNVWIRDVKNIPSFFLPEYWEIYHPIQEGVQYRPVRVASFALDYAIWKTNPVGFHLTNVLIHLANTLLLYAALWFTARLRKEEYGTGWMLLPFVTAALFAVHPIHSESINFVKNRSELMAMFFVMLSLGFLAAGWGKTGRRFFLSWMGALLCCFLAFASKETAFALPILAVFGGLLFQDKENWKNVVFKSLPLFIMLGGFVAMRAVGLNGAEGQAGESLEFSKHVAVIAKTVTTYIWMLVFPVGQTVEPAMPENLFSLPVLGGGLILAGACVYGILVRKTNPLFVFALGWILITMGPSSNLHYLDARPLAEQRLYMPSVGFCLILGQVFFWMLSTGGKVKKASALAALLAIVLSYSAGSVGQNRLWANPIALWTRAAETAPENFRIQYNLGNAYLEADMAEQAASRFEKSLELQPGNPEAMNNLGHALLSLGRDAEGITHISKALEIDPHNAIYYYNMGNAMADSGNDAQAAMYYDLALGIDPGFTRAHNNLGKILADMGKVDQAYEHLSIAVEQDATNAEAHYNFANVLSMKGQLDQARQYYEKSMELDPAHTEIHHDLGSLFTRLGEFSLAEEHYRKALKHNSDDHKIYANLANALSRQGKYTEAMPHYEKALEMAPGNALIHTNMGLALADLGRVEEAVSHFEKAIESEPDFAPAYYNKGYVLAKKGDHKQAFEFFRKAIELKPDYGQAYYELGNSFTHLGLFDRAILSYEKALETDPNNPKIHHNLGIVFARTGRLEEAADSFGKALQLKPDYYEARKHLAQVRKLMESH